MSSSSSGNNSAKWSNFVKKVSGRRCNTAPTPSSPSTMPRSPSSIVISKSRSMINTDGEELSPLHRTKNSKSDNENISSDDEDLTDFIEDSSGGGTSSSFCSSSTSSSGLGYTSSSSASLLFSSSSASPNVEIGSGSGDFEALGSEPGGVLNLSKFLGNQCREEGGEGEEEILDDSEEGILYIVGFGTLLVKGGTFQKLVEKLCDHLRKDDAYDSEFLQVGHYFTTPSALLAELKIQFDKKPDVDPLWRTQALQNNRQKILKLCQKWTEMGTGLELRSVRDPLFFSSFIDFIDSKMKPSGLDVTNLRNSLLALEDYCTYPPSLSTPPLFPSSNSTSSVIATPSVSLCLSSYFTIAPSPSPSTSSSSLSLSTFPSLSSVHSITPAPPLSPRGSGVTSSPSSFFGPKSPSFSSLSDVLDTDPKLLARALSVLEWEMYQGIGYWEYTRQAWSKKDKAESLSPNILTFIRHFNKFSMWLSSYVLSALALRKRVTKLENVLKFIEELIQLKNFNGVHEGLAGLNITAVKRLKETWSELSKTAQKIWVIADSFQSANYKSEREAMEKAANTPGQPCIPFLGMYLSDLVFTEDGNPEALEPYGYVNFGRLRKLSRTFKNIQRFQKVRYPAKMEGTLTPEVRKFFDDLPVNNETAICKLSNQILPRGTQKTERQIEKESGDSGNEVVVMVYFYSFGKSSGPPSSSIIGAGKRFKFSPQETVSHCKRSICSRIQTPQKLTPSEYLLFTPIKNDFPRFGGFRLDEQRTIGSYRLQREDQIIITKATIAEPNSPRVVLDEETSILVSLHAIELSTSKTLKVDRLMTIEDLRFQFLRKLVAPDRIPDFVLANDTNILDPTTTLAMNGFKVKVELSCYYQKKETQSQIIWLSSKDL